MDSVTKTRIDCRQPAAVATLMLKVKLAIVFLATLLSGCQSADVSSPLTSESSVYDVVIDDLTRIKPADARFVGRNILVSPTTCEGDVLVHSWGDETAIPNELQSALRDANVEASPIEKPHITHPLAKIQEIESFRDLYYYGKDKQDVDASCVIQFWKAEFSDGDQRAVVRFSYGPTPHGAAGTYTLEWTEQGWKIIESTISYYL